MYLHPGLLTASPNHTPSPQHSSHPLMFPPYKEVHRELDIPPDDISVEDSQFCQDVPILSLDELPPPPDELLMDAVYVKTASCSTAHRQSCDSVSEPFSGENNN